jgi:hypothetical protein
MRGKAPNTKLQAPEKHQTPSSKLQRNIKHQVPEALSLQLDGLELLWSFSLHLHDQLARYMALFEQAMAFSNFIQ